MIHRQPVYIYLPIDKTEDPVDPTPLKTPIDAKPKVDREAQDAAVAAIVDALYAAKNASLLVDYLSNRYAQAEAQSLTHKMMLPTYTTRMGRGCADQDNPNFVGTYDGATSAPGIATAIESSDLVISVGTFSADTNTAYFSRKYPVENLVDIMPTHVTVSEPVQLTMQLH